MRKSNEEEMLVMRKPECLSLRKGHLICHEERVLVSLWMALAVDSDTISAV